MAESRLQRWARKKAEAGKHTEQSPPAVTESEPTPEQQELAINEALPEHELLEKYGLPDPESIQLGTDITGFMRKEIPELLRRKALRGLWRSNPVLAVLDGLNDYDEDYTLASTAGQTVKTVYKVGQGLVEKARDADGVLKSQTEPPTDTPSPDVVQPVAETPEPDAGADSEHTAPRAQFPDHSLIQNESHQSKETPEPRYRPRMRFDH